MRAEDIRELSDEEIRSRIAELEDERFRLRFRSATQTLEDPLRLRVLRKDVARMQTVLRERALGLRAGSAAGAAAGGGRAAGGRRARATKSAGSRKTRGTRAGRARER
jgi:large subunit ribosomal protein L29